MSGPGLLERVAIGPRPTLVPATAAELEALGLRTLAALAASAPPAETGAVRVTGQFLHGYDVRTDAPQDFRVLTSTDGGLVDETVKLVIDAVQRLVIVHVEQAGNGGVRISDLKLEPLGGDLFRVVDFGLDYDIALQMHTEWDDSLAVVLEQNVYAFRPGAGQMLDQRGAVKGPSAAQGVTHGEVRVINTMGRPVEAVGHWSIDLSFSLTVGGKLAAEQRIKGSEPRGRVWTLPFRVGLGA